MIDKIKERLKGLQDSASKSTGTWKPTDKHEIRIVPYKFNSEFPFIELYFHYSLGGKTYLSPKSFGNPDPILEFAKKLKESKDPESYKLSKKLTPKMRTYVPVIVRGEEKEGVKFWGFGKTIYEEILKIMADEEYGDVSDPITGTDLVVEYTTPEQANNDFGSTSIRAKRKSSKLSNNPSEVKSFLENQKVITEIYKEPTYDELKTALEEWMNKSDEEETTTTATSSDTTEDSEEDTKTVENASAAFDNLFNKNKK